MAPIAVARMYKGNERKKRRPWANIHNVLSEFQTKEEKESINVFDALFTQNIKLHKKERTVKHRNKEDKECKSHAKELHYKRRIETKLETVNVTISLEDTVLDTTFDRILAGPVFQHPKPVDNSHKSKEFNSSVINSEDQSDLKCSASEPSCDDENTFPSTWKTRKKPIALRRRKSLSKHFVAEANSPLQLLCNLKIHASKSKTLDMNPCLTSTPKRRNNCKEKTQITPLISPILHIIDKGQGSGDSNEKEEKSSYQNAASLSKLPIITCNTGKNISKIPYAPELHQFDSCNTSNVLSAPLIDAEKVSSSLNKLSSHKVDSLYISVNKVLTDSVDVTKNVPSQLQSLSHKSDERIVATIADTNILHDTHCELIDLMECFTCKEDNMISGSEPCMSDSVTDVSTNGSVISTAVLQCENVNMRRQKKKHLKREEKNLYNSDLSSGKDFLGFSSMSLCVDSDSTKTSKILNSEFVECEVTKDYEDKKCISPSKSSNLSVILFDSWDSVANGKLEFTSERPSGSVENKEEIFQTSTEESDNCNSIDNPSQKSIMPSTDIGKSLHINNLRSHPAKKSKRHTGDEEDMLCSDVSKCHLLQESSVYVNESHNDPRSHRTQEFEVHIMDELLHSEKHVLQESSVLSIGKGASHNNDPAQEVSVHAEICPDLEHVDENTGLGRYVAEELAISANTEHNSNMTVNKQKSLKRYSSRRFSLQVVPCHAFNEEQVKLPSFRDVYHISPCKTTRKCKSELTVTLQEEDKEEFKVLSILEESALQVSYTFTARDVVLQRCCQLAPISFSEAFPASYWLTCKKIGEGLYGEVFLSEGDDSSVLKIIPIEGDALVNGEPQKKFEEILSEIVIAMELSNLRNGTENRTQSFSEVKRCLCVQGVYPRELINLWQDYDKSKGSENDSPTMFKEDQLYIILQLANGGCDLEAHVFTTADQSHSVLIQTAYALAVAEESLEFEHRDLHWGNVLISQTTEKYIIFRLCGKEYSVPTKGVQVAIIDFTLSRMSYDGCSIYNDLSKDPALFTSEGDYQFEVYRLMQKQTLDNWHNFKPYTNLLWLYYLLDKMRTMVNYRRKSTKSHKQGMKMLEKLQDVVLIYTSAQDFIVNEVL